MAVISLLCQSLVALHQVRCLCKRFALHAEMEVVAKQTHEQLQLRKAGVQEQYDACFLGFGE